LKRSTNLVQALRDERRRVPWGAVRIIETPG
jgi:hypothetical protein